MLLPRQRGIGGRLPIGKPFAAIRLITRPALGSQRDVVSAITVDIAETEIMAQSRRITAGENVPSPGLGGPPRWKPALLVGFAGATASFGWFTAFTLQQPALVKVVAQIEMLFTFASSVFFFKESLNKIEIAGCILITAGIVLLVS